MNCHRLSLGEQAEILPVQEVILDCMIITNYH